MQTNTRKSTKVQKIFTTLFPRRNFLEKREVVAAESHSILRAVPSRPGDHDDNSDNDDNSNNDDDIYGDDDDGNSDNDDDNSDGDDNLYIIGRFCVFVTFLFIYGSRSVFMGIHGSRLVILSSRSVFMVFPGSRLVFHVSRLVFHGFS